MQAEKRNTLRLFLRLMHGGGDPKVMHEIAKTMQAS